MNIEINWLSDYYDCDQAGCSGGYSEGAIVKVDGNTILELIPKAHCFGGDHWDRDAVYILLIQKLIPGATVEDYYE